MRRNSDSFASWKAPVAGLRIHVLTGTGRALGMLRISQYQRVSVLQEKKKAAFYRSFFGN